MTDREQTDAFAKDLDRLVDRYASEFELTFAQLVGVLEIKKVQLVMAGSREIEE